MRYVNPFGPRGDEECPGNADCKPGSRCLKFGIIDLCTINDCQPFSVPSSVYQGREPEFYELPDDA